MEREFFIYEAIVERIRRIVGGSTVQEFADALEVTKPTIYNWKTGAGLDLVKIQHIAQRYDVTVEWILFGDDERDERPSRDTGDLDFSVLLSEVIGKINEAPSAQKEYMTLVAVYEITRNAISETDDKRTAIGDVELLARHDAGEGIALPLKIAAGDLKKHQPKQSKRGKKGS